MKLIISAKNFQMTEALKDIITSKLSFLTKFINNECKVNVILDSQKYGKKIEITLCINSLFIKAEESNNDLYVAIDLVIDKLKKRINKTFNKYNMNSIESIRYLKEEDIIDAQIHAPKIEKRKVFDLKPMIEDEAIMQMQLLKHKVFMFFNASTEAMCLLYQRKGNSYGLLQFNKEENKDIFALSEKISKRKYFKTVPMTENKAIIQSKLLGHDFFIFSNKETKTMCLLYKRKNNSYGLIEGIY